MPLNPGDKAPDITLLDQNGEPFSLSKSLKQRKVWHLIYFYPVTKTVAPPGLTATALAKPPLRRLTHSWLPGTAASPAVAAPCPRPAEAAAGAAAPSPASNAAQLTAAAIARRLRAP
jgi:hypothetical protein